MDYMASTSGETTVPTEPDAATPDEAQYFIDALGADTGPAVYLHMIGLMAILDSTPIPILHPALRDYLDKNKVNPSLVIVEDRTHMTVANNPSQARHFRREILLRRYQETMRLGETILRAPR